MRQLASSTSVHAFSERIALANFEKLKRMAASLADRGSCEEASETSIEAAIFLGQFVAHAQARGAPIEDLVEYGSRQGSDLRFKLAQCSIPSRSRGPVNGLGDTDVLKRIMDTVHFRTGETISLQDDGYEYPWGSAKIFGLPWWMVAGGGALLLLGLAKGTQEAVKVIDKKITVSAGRKKYGDLIEVASKQAGIPKEILTTFVALESGFNPESYNPEETAIARWSKQIAEDSRWKVNPDYANAVSVAQKTAQDPSLADAIANRSGKNVPYEQKLWKFGSFGLGQISAIAARGGGGLAYSRSNKDLFKPEVNLPTAARIIAALRAKVYPGRGSLTTEEWSRVRAAYVGGPGILQKGPTKAAEIASRFIAKTKELAA